MSNELAKVNKGLSGQYGPQFINPNEGTEPAYNIITYTDPRTGGEKVAYCVSYMANSDFIIADNILYKQQVSTYDPDIALKAKGYLTLRLDIYKKQIEGTKEFITVCSGWNRNHTRADSVSFSEYYNNRKSRIFIPIKNLIDITAEFDFPDPNDINDENDLWLTYDYKKAKEIIIEEYEEHNQACEEESNELWNNDEDIELIISYLLAKNAEAKQREYCIESYRKFRKHKILHFFATIKNKYSLKGWNNSEKYEYFGDEALKKYPKESITVNDISYESKESLANSIESDIKSAGLETVDLTKFYKALGFVRKTSKE